jgi:myo-inositol-1(or 4)-monophosphatase
VERQLDNKEVARFVEVAEQASRAGAERLTARMGRFTVTEKAPADLVTEADRESEAAVQEVIRSQFPDHGFLCEESGRWVGQNSEFTWLVDPLDGTTNFVHGVPDYCVSVALRHSKKVIAGVVYNPAVGECYRAGLGLGADLNGKSIRVSRVRQLEDALVAVSFSAKVKADSEEVSQFVRILVRAQGVRRMGSAAMNLCYVAAGRFDAYWAFNTKTWDVAAGFLIITEAGGTVEAIPSGAVDLDHPRFISAATPELASEVRSALLTGTT